MCSTVNSELLSALKRAIDYLEFEGRSDMEHILQEMRAAVDKAEGR